MNPPPPQQFPQSNVQVGGGLAVPTQPAEMAYPLRRDTFELLCETETINEDKRWRDIALAFFAAAIAGLVSFMGSTEWDATFASKNWVPLKCAVLLGVLSGVSLLIFIIQQIKVWRKPDATGYARIKAKIRAWYEEHQS